jgi:putative peptide zinc metalloprotease protein
VVAMDALNPGLGMHPYYHALRSVPLALHPALEHSEQNVRDGRWVVLSLAGGDTHYRCRERVFNWLQQLDGRLTLDELLGLLGPGPEQDQGLRVLYALYQAGFLEASAPAPGSGVHWGRRLGSFLMLRLGGEPPAILVALLQWLAPRVLRVGVGWCWVLWVLWGLYYAGGQQAALVEHWGSRFLDPSSLLLLYLAYPLLKLVHELSHALALVRWGGSLGQIGVVLMVFVPLPFVDASAAHHFSRRRQRILVGSAGVMAELGLAVAGLLLWSQSAEGVWRDLGFNIAFIGAVSSLLFNGNPLMRFDGYYVLSDALKVHNLNGRSFRYLGSLLRRYIWAFDPVDPIPGNSREAWILGSYGVLSFIYRCFVYYWICYYLLTHFFVLGVVLSLLAFYLLFLAPVYKAMAGVFLEARRNKKLPRTLVSTVLVSGLCGWVVFGYQGTLSWALEAAVQVAPEAQVRAMEAGFVVVPLLAHGSQVEPGDRLFELDSPELKMQYRLAQSELAELRRLYRKDLGQDRSDSLKWQARLDAKAGELQNLRRRLGSLQVNAQTSGQFVHADLSNRTARFIAQGDLVGYVIAPGVHLNLIVAVRQLAADLVNRHNPETEVRFAAAPDRIFRARLVRHFAAATHELMDPAFGSDQGGGIPVDIREEEPRAKERIFYFEVELEAPWTENYLPRLAQVKLALPGVTLFEKWTIFWRDRLLTEFGWL